MTGSVGFDVIKKVGQKPCEAEGGREANSDTDRRERHGLPHNHVS